MTEFTQSGIDRLRDIMNDGGEYWSRALALDALDEIERLQKENKELKEFVDATRPTGICEICTSNVISRYEPLQARVQELEQERRWIPVSERLPEEDGYYYVVIELSGKRFFTELYYSNSQSKIKWFFENSCTRVTTFFDNVVYWTIRPQPPQEGE